jgi:hypothetical protein
MGKVGLGGEWEIEWEWTGGIFGNGCEGCGKGFGKDFWRWGMAFRELLMGREG